MDAGLPQARTLYGRSRAAVLDDPEIFIVLAFGALVKLLILLLVFVGALLVGTQTGSVTITSSEPDVIDISGHWETFGIVSGIAIAYGLFAGYVEKAVEGAVVVAGKQRLAGGNPTLGRTLATALRHWRHLLGLHLWSSFARARWAAEVGSKSRVAEASNNPPSSAPTNVSWALLGLPIVVLENLAWMDAFMRSQQLGALVPDVLRAAKRRYHLGYRWLARGLLVAGLVVGWTFLWGDGPALGASILVGSAAFFVLWRTWYGATLAILGVAIYDEASAAEEIPAPGTRAQEA